MKTVNKQEFWELLAGKTILVIAEDGSGIEVTLDSASKWFDQRKRERKPSFFVLGRDFAWIGDVGPSADKPCYQVGGDL